MTNPGMIQLREAAVKVLTQTPAERRADPVIDAFSQPSPLDLPAIALCMAAYERARLAARSRNKSEFDSREEGKAAYKAAMPALISRHNISDFIACVAYADLRGLIFPVNTDHLLSMLAPLVSCTSPALYPHGNPPRTPVHPSPLRSRLQPRKTRSNRRLETCKPIKINELAPQKAQIATIVFPKTPHRITGRIR